MALGPCTGLPAHLPPALGFQTEAFQPRQHSNILQTSEFPPFALQYLVNFSRRKCPSLYVDSFPSPRKRTINHLASPANSPRRHTAAMACAECRKLLRPRYMVNAKGQARAPEGSRFYRSISELRSSSTSCSICLALVRKLPPDAEFRQLWSKTVSLRPDGVACYMASLHESSQSTGTYQLILQLFGIGNRTLKLPMMAEKNQLVNSEFLLVPLPMSAEVCGDESRPQAPSETSSTTSSASSLDMAKGWLEKCLQHHPLCRVGSLLPETSHGPLFLPTRVIHILPGIIRLYTTSGSEGEDFRYATLSHRWPLNSDSILQLTTDNIGHWHSEIEQGDSFSQAFRDAIAVCKHLGIEYLWIDSLCIIQHGDGGQDWQLEAARMGAVYKHGLVNIAATSVADGEEGLEKGFFRSRAPSLVLPNVVTQAAITTSRPGDKER